jgi:hypothetical protein
VISRDTFNQGSDIITADNAGAMTTRVTDDTDSNTSPAIGPIEASEIDPTQF